MKFLSLDFTDWCTTKKYKILNSRKQLVSKVREESDACARFCSGIYHSCNFTVHDMSNREVKESKLLFNELQKVLYIDVQ